MPEIPEQPVEIQLENLRHKHAMEELEYKRETAEKVHEWNMEEFRIQNAEHRKHYEAELNRQKELILFRKENWMGDKK